jgi:LPS O-antigen subunit length determinant protein (WzzB/FepE family)
MKVTERLATEFTEPESARLQPAIGNRQVGQQFRLIEPARLPDGPIDPMRARYVGFGAAVGLVVGVLVALGMTIGRHWSSKRPLTQTA